MSNDIFNKKSKPLSPELLRIAKLQKKLDFFLLYSRSLEKKVDALKKKVEELEKTLDLG